MTGDDVLAAMRDLGRIYPPDLAEQSEVSERTVRRWMADGCDGVAEAAFRYALRLHKLGVPWWKNEVPIALTENGVAFLSDLEAAQRYARIRTDFGGIPVVHDARMAHNTFRVINVKLP
jgi:hypothetical protein